MILLFNLICKCVIAIVPHSCQLVVKWWHMQSELFLNIYTHPLTTVECSWSVHFGSIQTFLYGPDQTKPLCLQSILNYPLLIQCYTNCYFGLTEQVLFIWNKIWNSMLYSSFYAVFLTMLFENFIVIYKSRFSIK